MQLQCLQHLKVKRDNGTPESVDSPTRKAKKVLNFF